LPNSPDRVEEIKVKLSVRNASELPINVVQIAYEVQTRWLDQTGEIAYEPIAGLQPIRSFVEKITVPPQETLDGSYDHNVAHTAPRAQYSLNLSGELPA
jgi:hypothetical protein